MGDNNPNAERKIHVPVQIPSPDACSVCTTRLATAVDMLPGVGSVEIDPATSLLAATLVGEDTSAESITDEINRIGYEIADTIGHATWRVEGLDCPDCARTVDIAVARIDGVLSADLNFASAMLLIEFDPEEDPRQEVVGLLSRMGYAARSMGDDSGRPIAEFEISGLDCADCAESLRLAIDGLGGVGDVRLDFATARMRVGFDASATTPAELLRAIGQTGYKGRLLGAESTHEEVPVGWFEDHKHDLATGLSGALIVLGWILGFLGAPEILAVGSFAGAIVTGGSLVARRAVASLRARTLDMNVLMTIAVLGAAGIGEWQEGAMVVFLFAIGGLLESRSLARTRSSIRDLMDLAPERVRVLLADGTEELVPSADVIPGQRFRVLPGERVALDGIVTVGNSAIDESAITGESVPNEKKSGSEVFAGTLNTTGMLEIEITALASHTTLSRVIQMVEEAQAQQAPLQRLVDRFTRYYTPAVVALAILVATLPPLVSTLFGLGWGGFQEWFYRALVLLVVSCPCALVISTPVAVVSAITRATKDGVLIKGGAFLEMAPKIKAVAFDKTGTLTQGRPEVAEVIALNGMDAHEIIHLAAAAERYSTHPLAQAVLRAHASDNDLPELQIEEVPGRGIKATGDGINLTVGSASFLLETGFSVTDASAEVERMESEGNTVLLLARNDEVLGVIGISDLVREASAGAVAALHESGIDRTVMLTGDNERTAQAIAGTCGVGEVRARLLPQDKLDAIASLKEDVGAVAMVGDGINDAPALAAADIGIAMGAAGSDTALDTADVALMSDDLNGIPRFLDLGRRTVANIWQNVVFSVAVKVAVLIAAMFGVATLWMAVFADTGVALLVILNGLRLLRSHDSA